MDFARIDPRRDAEEGATYHVEYEGERLYHDKQPIEIDFLGVDGTTGKRAAAKMVKRLNRKTGGKRNAAKMGVDEILAAGAESEQAQAEFYAALCTGWRHVCYLDDDQMDDPDATPEPLSFSRENARKLFSTRPWIMGGIDDFLGDKQNFSRKAVSGS